MEQKELQNKNNIQRKTQKRILKNAKAYCMTVGSDAPSSKPSPLLHFTLDPLRHKLDARTRANKNRALTNAHVSAYDYSHFAAMLVAMCFKKCSASLWRSPSTKGVKYLAYLPLPFYIASSSLEPLCPKLILHGVRCCMVRLCQ